MITHLLDTSAVLAHYLKEPGAEDVNAVLAKGPAEVALSIVSLPELRTRLALLVANPAEAENVFKSYANVLTSAQPVTRATADLAMELRALVRPRLPLVDSLVAATAKELNAVLVHRDPHMAAIPATVVRQLVLPPKT